ncbi:hypothetical protein BD770DRAFT_129946 [Pilaira anomala]|nr:hypothetical protein BD770DRAFT_129946 [Pilaira anomala]
MYQKDTALLCSKVKFYYKFSHTNVFLTFFFNIVPVQQTTGLFSFFLLKQHATVALLPGFFLKKIKRIWSKHNGSLFFLIQNKYHTSDGITLLCSYRYSSPQKKMLYPF